MVYLHKKNGKIRLLVNDKPFLVFGGELGNSSASSLACLASLWPRLADLNLNTVLVPVYWELLEPVENRFDFTLLDAIIEEARRWQLRLVLLWFGSWKNSMSCYVPAWIKQDQQRFPRTRLADGRPQEILSAHAPMNRDTDARAFRTLMQHLYNVDKRDQTVIMVQVENEVAMVSQARDHSDLAEQAYRQPVPAELMNRLKENKNNLAPGLLELWQAGGCRMQGSWQEVFGPGPGGV